MFSTLDIPPFWPSAVIEHHLASGHWRRLAGGGGGLAFKFCRIIAALIDPAPAGQDFVHEVTRVRRCKTTGREIREFISPEALVSSLRNPAWAGMAGMVYPQQLPLLPRKIWDLVALVDRGVGASISVRDSFPPRHPEFPAAVSRLDERLAAAPECVWIGPRVGKLKAFMLSHSRPR